MLWLLREDLERTCSLLTEEAPNLLRISKRFPFVWHIVQGSPIVAVYVLNQGLPNSIGASEASTWVSIIIVSALPSPAEPF